MKYVPSIAAAGCALLILVVTIFRLSASMPKVLPACQESVHVLAVGHRNDVVCPPHQLLVKLAEEHGTALWIQTFKCACPDTSVEGHTSPSR